MNDYGQVWKNHLDRTSRMDKAKISGRDSHLLPDLIKGNVWGNVNSSEFDYNFSFKFIELIAEYSSGTIFLFGDVHQRF